MCCVKEWIVAGSSPSAEQWIGPALDAVPKAKIITTNRGSKLFADRQPDVYFFGDEYLDDPEQFKEHRETARKLKAKGARIVGLNRTGKVKAAWDIEWIDEFLTVDVGPWSPWKFIKGHYTAVRLSGLFCLQYAINHGATSIHLVGMEGYGDDEHYFDDGAVSRVAKDSQLTLKTIQPFTQQLIDRCPDVDFRFYGELNYHIVAGNATIMTKADPGGTDAAENWAAEASGQFPTAEG